MAPIEHPQKRRLNPFAFPSETNARFTLLVGAALMLGFSVLQSLLFASSLVQAPDSLNALLLPAVLLLCAILVAVVIYRSHPERIRRRKKLRILTAAEDPRLAAAMEELVRLSGLDRAPAVEVAAGAQVADGQAFGLPGRYAVRLGGRLPLLLRQRPESFRAIILHELGHIANEDVPRTYIAQAIWTSLVPFAVIPALAFIAISFVLGLIEKQAGGLTGDEVRRIFSLNLPTVLIGVLQLGGTLAIAASVRSSLLRTREIYADWRAALWGAETALQEILRRSPSEPGRGPWSRLWRLHPSIHERLAALENPDGLFRVANDLAFFVGALLAYFLDGWFSLVSYLGLALMPMTEAQLNRAATGLDSPMIIFEAFLIFNAVWAAFLAVALALNLGGIYLIAGTLGVQVQREAVADLSAGKSGAVRYLRLWKTALIFSTGFLIGMLLTPFEFAALLPDLIRRPDGLVVLRLLVLLGSALTYLTWLWIVQERFFARRILGSRVGNSPPHRLRRILTLASSVSLLVLFLPLLPGFYAMWAAATGHGLNLSQGLLVFYVSLAAVSLLYFGAFAGVWLLVRVIQQFGRPRCPACGRAISRAYTVGQNCEQCGQSLSPWLFVDQPAGPAWAPAGLSPAGLSQEIAQGETA